MRESSPEEIAATESRRTEREKLRARLIQPASAAETVQELEDLSSPIASFIRDRCRVGPECTVEINRLFEAWTDWCRTQGRDHPGTAQSFGRDLRAALPELKTTAVATIACDFTEGASIPSGRPKR